MMKFKFCVWIMILLLTAVPAAADENQPVPTPGVVTMLELGADRCVPCKMMAPIVEELKQEYAGRVSIVFIDVWKNPEQGNRYDIQSIPTQIFYDKDGKEIDRHVGFLSKKRIVKRFRKMGVPEQVALNP